MSTFFKLNGLGLTYALSLFIQVEFVLNHYRIVRITNISHTGVSLMSGVIILLLLVVTTVVGFYCTRRLFGDRKVRFFNAVIWIPYFYLLIKAFADLFPITDPGEVPLGAIGLVILCYIMIYPLYIVMISFASSSRPKQILSSS